MTIIFISMFPPSYSFRCTFLSQKVVSTVWRTTCTTCIQINVCCCPRPQQRQSVRIHNASMNCDKKFRKNAATQNKFTVNSQVIRMILVVVCSFLSILFSREWYKNGRESRVSCGPPNRKHCLSYLLSCIYWDVVSFYFYVIFCLVLSSFLTAISISTFVTVCWAFLLRNCTQRLGKEHKHFMGIWMCSYVAHG